MPPDAPPGRVIGEKYRLVRPLGVGGVGEVFEAVHTWTTRRVAVKLLRPEYSRDEVVAQRFLQEAKNATSVSHPNIVDVLDMGRDGANGALYLVQELMQGGDLRDHLSQFGKLSLDETLAIVVPIMGAVVAAEQRGIIHRDIKPENIFLADEAGTAVPKLIDFGISKISDPVPRGERSLTIEGIAIGTPEYMSPEQARGDVEIDARSDVWAIAMVICEALTGEAPFAAATPTLVMMRVMSETAPRLDLLRPDVPAAFADIVARALERDRDMRFASMNDFLTAVLEFDCARTGIRPSPLAKRFESSLRALAPAAAVNGLVGEETTRDVPLPPITPEFDTATVAAVQPVERALDPTRATGQTPRWVPIAALGAIAALVAGVILWHRASPAERTASQPAPVSAVDAATAPSTAVRAPSIAQDSGVAPEPPHVTIPPRAIPVTPRRTARPRTNPNDPLRPATRWPGGH